MERRYVAFDIETAKILPEDYGNLHSYRPLGITCAAIWSGDKDKPQTFYSVEADGSPSPEMNPNNLSDIVDTLFNFQRSGYTIVTHNGLGFDFNILPGESGRTEDCKKLALRHVDMMFHIFCGREVGVGLNAATKAIGQSKPEGMSGSVAPRLWKEGEHQKVLDYVAQDCRLTLDIATKSEQEGTFRWITQKGKKLPLLYLQVGLRVKSVQVN